MAQREIFSTTSYLNVQGADASLTIIVFSSEAFVLVSPDAAKGGLVTSVAFDFGGLGDEGHAKVLEDFFIVFEEGVCVWLFIFHLAR